MQVIGLNSRVSSLSLVGALSLLFFRTLLLVFRGLLLPPVGVCCHCKHCSENCWALSIHSQHLLSLGWTYFVRQYFFQGLSTQPAGLQLLFGLLCSLTPHHSLRLGQEVGNQDLTNTLNTHLQIQGSTMHVSYSDTAPVSVCQVKACVSLWYVNISESLSYA